MKIYVVGSSNNNFLPLDNIREKFLINEKHAGDNIDFLNPWYCELTGLYYLWKHCDDDIVGMEHYRTYFWKNGHPINEAQVKDVLTKGDIICSGYAYPFHNHVNLYDELNACVNGDLNTFLNFLKTYEPNLCSYFCKFLLGQRMWGCNIFIGPKRIINEYCEFIFNMLIDYEEISPIGPRTHTLRREGFYTEFLFGAWLEYKGYKIIHNDVMKFTKDFKNIEFKFLGQRTRL